MGGTGTDPPRFSRSPPPGAGSGAALPEPPGFPWHRVRAAAAAGSCPPPARPRFPEQPGGGHRVLGPPMGGFPLGTVLGHPRGKGPLSGGSVGGSQTEAGARSPPGVKHGALPAPKVGCWGRGGPYGVLEPKGAAPAPPRKMEAQGGGRGGCKGKGAKGRVTR